MFFLGSFFCYAKEQYKEIAISKGKVIVGLSEEEAIKKFGLPSSAKDKLWQYSGPENLYIFVEKSSGIYLYPFFSNSFVGDPIELKVLAISKDIEDVTSKAEFIFSDSQAFDISGQSVIIPKMNGKYQIIAEHNGVRSNPIMVSIIEKIKNYSKDEDSQLLSIDVFPYSPRVELYEKVDFIAFGSFVVKRQHITKDITKDVEWYLEQDGKTKKLQKSNIEFSSPGIFRIFCKYEGIQSSYQKVEVVKNRLIPRKNLKNISIIPSNIDVMPSNTLPFIVLGTYMDNSVENITGKVSWDINDKTIIERGKDGVFIAKAPGIADVTASLKDIKSIPAKVVVRSDYIYTKFTNQELQRIKEEKNVSNNSEELSKIKEEEDVSDSPEELLNDIKKYLSEFKRRNITENKIKYIKITPTSYDISLGEEKEFSAFAVREDNAEEDVTILAEWRSLDEKIAIVNEGKIKTINIGETKIFAKFKNLESLGIPLIVREPKLVSITAYPAQVKISFGEQKNLTAQGYFSDSSRKDITPMVKWIFIKPGIVSIDEGKLKPIKIGQAKIFAEYEQMKSEPINIDVIRDKYWLINIFIKIAGSIFLLLIVFFCYFYALLLKTKNNIIKFYDKPRELVILLYENINKILDVINLRQKSNMSPLFYAKLIEEEYEITGDLFLRFTQTFEEAKYSKHKLSQEISHIIIDDYNGILKKLLSGHKIIVMMYISFRFLLNNTPTFIPKAR